MKKLSTKIITILALCIALNIVGSNIALLLKLPIYLDTIGTILAASLAGPVGGVTVGALTSIIVGLTTDLFSLYYLPVQLIVGLIAGIVYSHYAADTLKAMVVSYHHFFTSYFSKFCHYFIFIPRHY